MLGGCGDGEVVGEDVSVEEASGADLGVVEGGIVVMCAEGSLCGFVGGLGFLVDGLEFIVCDEGGVCEVEGGGEVTEHIEEGCSVEESVSEVAALGFFEQEEGGVLEECLGASDLLDEISEGMIGGDILEGLLDVFEEDLESLTVECAEFSGEEVEGLDAVGAFVDGSDLDVAEVLFDGIILCVAVTAVGLDGHIADFEAHIATVGFTDGCEKLDEEVVFFALFGVGVMV